MARWLTISDVEQLLHVPESTIQRWIRQGNLPCTERHGKYYFNRDTLFSWAKAKQIHVGKISLKRNKPQKIKVESWNDLLKAMKRGGMHRLEEQNSKEDLIQQATLLLPFPKSKRTKVTEQLLQREELSSTGLGNGIAIPHPRIPMKLELSESLVISIFLKNPLDYGSSDNIPVFFLFMLLSKDAREHLQILSQFARVLNDPILPVFLKQSPSLELLMEQFEKILAN